MNHYISWHSSAITTQNLTCSICTWKCLVVQKKKDPNNRPDYHDFVGIIVLLIINSTISFIEENNTGNAAAALMARLAPKAKVFSFQAWCQAFQFLLICLFFSLHLFTFYIFCTSWSEASAHTSTDFTRFYVMENGARKMLLCWF